MGLKESMWLKTLLRTDPRFKRCMSHASMSRARNGDRPPGAEGRRGPGKEPGYEVVVVELMLHVRKLLPGCQNLAGYAQKWKDLVATTMLRFPDAETFFFPFDDRVNVPKAKGQTQAKRGTGFTEEELEELGIYRFLCNDNPAGFDECIRNLYSEEANRMSRRRTVSAFEIFMAKHLRTSSLREDGFEFATRWIVAGAYADLGTRTRILIDGGVWRESFRRSSKTDALHGAQETWGNVVASFSDHLSLLRRLDVDKAPLVENDDPNPASRAWILMDGKGVRRIEQVHQAHLIGEADLKIPRYVRLIGGQKNIFIVCADTDLFAILLLMLRDLIPKKGRMPKKVTLDMTTSTDENPKRKKPKNPSSDPESPDYWVPDMPKPAPRPGVIDMCEVWRQMHHWYAEEFPEVLNPIENFVLYLIMLGTDFVKNPPKLAKAGMWKAYKEEGLANSILATAVYTDGRMGAALFSNQAEADAMLNLPGAEEDEAMATNRAALLLMRNCDAGGFLDAKQSSPEGQVKTSSQFLFRKHVSIHEHKLERFFNMAYLKAGQKDISKHPSDHWYRSQARRDGWNLGYWSGGDTFGGRQREDEMMGASLQQGQIKRKNIADSRGKESLHGWCWIKDPEPEEGSVKEPPKKRAKYDGPKERKGDMRRRKPRGFHSEPAETVAELKVFQRALVSVMKED